MREPAPTVGRRLWRLLRTLALPWLVCGGLLWGLVELTPSPAMPAPADGPAFRGLGVDWIGGTPLAAERAEVVFCWNRQGHIGEFDEQDDPAGGDLHLGLVWQFGESHAGLFSVVIISLWWLLPFPLLWSGFNLWRWVRRAG